MKERVEKWELGYEQLDYFNESFLSMDKFIRFISSFLFGLILISPVAASVLSIRLNSFGVEQSDFLEAINNFLLFLIVIHTVIVFYTENVFGMRKCIDFLSGKDRKLHVNFYLAWAIWFAVFSLYFVFWAMSCLELTVGPKIIFIIFILMCLISLPVGTLINHVKPSSRWGKGLIFFSLLTNLCLIFIYHPCETRYSTEIFEMYTLKFIWHLIAVFMATLIYLKFFYLMQVWIETNLKKRDYNFAYVN